MTSGNLIKLLVVKQSCAHCCGCSAVPARCLCTQDLAGWTLKWGRAMEACFVVMLDRNPLRFCAEARVWHCDRILQEDLTLIGAMTFEDKFVVPDMERPAGSGTIKYELSRTDFKRTNQPFPEEHVVKGNPQQTKIGECTLDRAFEPVMVRNFAWPACWTVSLLVPACHDNQESGVLLQVVSLAGGQPQSAGHQCS